MDLEEYIDKLYNGRKEWFADECETVYNMARISDVVNYKNYLDGQHKILLKEDMKYKEQEYITRKLVINEAKTILNFHSTYLLGKPLTLVGTENMVKEYQKIYRKGHYNDVDFTLMDSVGKYGDAYEYVYLNDNKKIVSKVIDSADAYPVISETNEYVGFIEHYIINAISYYIVYTQDTVEEWNNEDEELHMTSTFKNISGLPIHYHGLSDVDSNFGVSVLKDIMPILDELEDLLSKLGDSIYVNSLSPLLVSIGQPITGTLNADGVGYCIGLEAGSDLKYVSSTMDYNTIKLYLDTLGQKLNMVAHMPSIVSGGNIANVSEVSLKLLYQLADVLAMFNERCMTKGLDERFEVFANILSLQGTSFAEDDYVEANFNYSRPQNATDLLDNMVKQFGMGAISIRSIVEKSPLTGDVQQELDRIDEEAKAKALVDNNSTDITNVDANGNVIATDLNTENNSQNNIVK